jgi:predicted metal-dependent enzyme (double-stranded beta helix superfamily)
MLVDTGRHSSPINFNFYALAEGDAVPLGQDVIHSVTNPIPRLTGAIHVYGGDFFGVARSEWDAETLLEQRSDGEKMARRFEEANALWKLKVFRDNPSLSRQNP